jgi:hypothetical protein
MRRMPGVFGIARPVAEQVLKLAQDAKVTKSRTSISV